MGNSSRRGAERCVHYVYFNANTLIQLLQAERNGALQPYVSSLYSGVAMLQKNSKPSYIKFIKKGAVVLFVAEAFAFAVSYGAWHRMNTNRDFRLYMSEKFPFVLDSYYKFGELMGCDSKHIRKIDAAYWENEPKSTKK